MTLSSPSQLNSDNLTDDGLSVLKGKVSMIVWNTVEQDARVQKEAQTLARNRFDVSIFALMNPGTTPDFEQIEHRLSIVRVRRSYTDFLNRKKTAPIISEVVAKPTNNKIRSLIQVGFRLIVHLHLMYKLTKSKADIIHAHDVNTLPTAWLAAKLSGAKLVYDAHEISTDREGYQRIRKFIGCVEGFLMPKANATITTTNLRARFFARAYKIARPIVLQNRPRLEEDATSNSQQLRKQLNLKQSWPIVLYQGGLQQGRGLVEFVEVAANVKNAYFVLIGGGRMETQLKTIAASSPASDRIFFVPTVKHSQLKALTNSADIGVQPLENTCLNHYTTDSNKLFEYIHSGLAIVSSNFPIIREVIENSNCGILVPPGNKGMLQKAIKQLVDDKKLRTRFKANSKKNKGNYSWQKQEKLLLQVYQEILS